MLKNKVAYLFLKSSRLKTSRQFRYISREGKRYYGRSIMMLVHGRKISDSQSSKKISYNSSPRLGVTVTKRFGNAVARNRFKRCVREAFRLIQNELPENMDILIKAKNIEERPDMSRIYSEIKEFLQL